MKAAQIAENEDISFALDEQESNVILDSVIKRAQEAVFTHIRQSTDIVLVTSTNREGKSVFVNELSKEIDSEIRSLSLRSEDLINTSSQDRESSTADFSLLSSIIYDSIQLDEYLLISIDDADRLPIENFNDLVTLALNTNTKKNNIIFLFAGGPELLSQIEQISNIRRLSIAHCTLDELTFEDLAVFVDLRQSDVPEDRKYNFDEQALTTVVTHASGSLFKAAVLLEWCRDYANYRQDLEINAGTVSQLLSVLLNKSQTGGVNLFASYPAPGFNFTASDSDESTQNKPKKSAPKARRSRKKTIKVKNAGEKSTSDRTTLYERVMADASEEELISDPTPTIATIDSDIEDENTDQANNNEQEIEEIVITESVVADEQPIEIISFAANKNEDESVELPPAKPHEESMPLYIENTDLSLTRLVPKQNNSMGSLSSLQWTFIILIVGAILFYGGIMFIAANGKPSFIPTIVGTATETVEPNDNVTITEAIAIPPGNTVITEEPVTESAEEDALPELLIEQERQNSSISFFQRLKSLVLKLGNKEKEINENMAESATAVETENIALPASLNSQKGNTIHALLNLAQTQIKSDKLTTPASDNAVDTYRMVLQLDPENESARAGIESIRVRYLIWAEKAAVAGDSSKAQRYLEQAVELSPTNF